MKRKKILYTFILTVLLLIGCGRRNTENLQNTQNSSVSNTTTPSTSETSQASDQTHTVHNSTETGTRISEEDAKQIALSHAKLIAEQVTFIKSGIDRENGREIYDIEFYTLEQKEYDYEIDVYSGEILEWDIDTIYGSNS